MAYGQLRIVGQPVNLGNFYDKSTPIFLVDLFLSTRQTTLKATFQKCRNRMETRIATVELSIGLVIYVARFV